MDSFVGAAGRNLVPDGSGYKDDGEPSEELALNAAQLRAFGSTPAYESFQAFERAMWAFYGRHSAADRATAQQRAVGVDDPSPLHSDRGALANAVDQLRAKFEAFSVIVRRELGTDQ